MKIRITKSGIYGADGPIEVGTEVVLRDTPPKGWRGFYETVSPGASSDAVAITNEEWEKRLKTVEAERDKALAELEARRKSEDGEDELAKLLSGTIPDVEKAIAGMTTEKLDALETAEKAGKDRDGIAKAIEKRREELAGE